jgi:arginine N-succinyltransferase
VLRGDEERLLDLAKYLDSVNLPNRREEIEEVVRASDDAFTGAVEDPCHRQYVFVLEDLEEDRAVGTSMIIGQLGRRDAPYIYFDVLTEEKYSPTFDRHFKHQVLSIGYSFDGPTEIGGLVMDPEYRRAPEKLGMLISYVRFLFIAVHRDLFRDQLLAELLPPLMEDESSHLWEAVGRHFTDMDYKEADLLSKKNKEFIRALFPSGDIYASLLPPEAQAVIGEVGPKTKGVEKLLRRIGFRYAKRVDPFDGGPHFVANTDEVTLVERTSRGPVTIGEPTTSRHCLLAREYDGPPYFRSVATLCDVSDEEITITQEAADHLGLQPGDPAAVLPLR